MKKASNDPSLQPIAIEMRKEYHFDYSQAKPNRFANELADKTIVVVLDPDVASVFQSSEAINALLRSVIAALPPQHKP